MCTLCTRSTVRRPGRPVTSWTHADPLPGPVVRIGPGTVNVTSIEALKTIYGPRETFRKSQFYRLLAVPGQQGLFNTIDVEFHRRHRRLLAGPMAESSLWSMLPIVEARLVLTIARMKQEMASRGAADVFKWWLFMATDVIGELTFGDSFRMLELGHARFVRCLSWYCTAANS